MLEVKCSIKNNKLYLMRKIFNEYDIKLASLEEERMYLMATNSQYEDWIDWYFFYTLYLLSIHIFYLIG